MYSLTVCDMDATNFTLGSILVCHLSNIQDEKQIPIYSLYCFSGGAEVVVLVAVEAVQEALQTLEDVKGLF